MLESKGGEMQMQILTDTDGAGDADGDADADPQPDEDIVDGRGSLMKTNAIYWILLFNNVTILSRP